MKAVGIAELKARLSEYLRHVRRGHTVTVVDRATPVAQLVPYPGASPSLVIRRPRAGALPPARVPLPPPLPVGLDVVDLLLEERQSER